MGKTKNKNKSEVEFLRGEVRRLKRQVKQLERTAHFFETAIVEEAPVEVKKVRHCNNCGKGVMAEFEIMDRVFATCGTCGHREKLK